MTNEQILEIARTCGIVTGDNLRKRDGYYYRSLGTPTNVRGTDLLNFARELLEWKPDKTSAMREAANIVMSSAFIGRQAFRNGRPRESLANDAERIGWDEAEYNSLNPLQDGSK